MWVIVHLSCTTPIQSYCNKELEIENKTTSLLVFKFVELQAPFCSLWECLSSLVWPAQAQFKNLNDVYYSWSIRVLVGWSHEGERPWYHSISFQKTPWPLCSVPLSLQWPSCLRSLGWEVFQWISCLQSPRLLKRVSFYVLPESNGHSRSW